jgi:hypothetical protein
MQLSNADLAINKVYKPTLLDWEELIVQSL